MDEEGPSADSLSRLERNIEQIFLFSVVWSIGGCLDNASRFKFSNFLRHLMDDRQSTVCFPPDGVVYDYCVEEPKPGEEDEPSEKESWKKIDDRISNEKQDPVK